jgi:MATE family multidrug resistance protein
MTDKLSPPGQNNPIEETSLRYMLKLATPMVVTTISFTIMQFVDRFMVSRLGTHALAAIMPAAFVSFLPGALALGSLASLNAYVSQSFGKGNLRDCSNYFWQAVYMGIGYFLMVLAIMWPTAPLIFELMGQPPTIIGMEVIYFRIMLYAHLIIVISWSSNQFFMGIHRPVITMCASLSGQIVNIIANYILIFGKLGLPAMGIAGAGWGTCIGMTVSALINTCVFLSPKINSTFYSRHTFGIDPGKMYDLFRVGLPAGIGLTMDVALWGVILSGLVGRFGEDSLAATSAVLSYTNLSVMPVVGISMALTAASGKTIGMDKKNLVIEQTNVCLKISLIYMGLVGICFFLFREALMEFWSSDGKVIDAGANILILAAVYQVFHAARVIYSGSLRGAGDTIWLAFASGIGSVIILGFGGFLIVKFFPLLGSPGPWVAATFSIVIVGLANHWRFKSKRWMKIDLFKRRTISVPIQNGSTVE